MLGTSVPAIGVEATASEAETVAPIPEIDVEAAAAEFGVSSEVARSRLEFEARFIEVVLY